MKLRSKKISTADEMVKKMKEGIHLIASITARTLGPGGRPVLIERTGQNLEGEALEPMITKDGVTVANECSHEDPEIDVVIQTVKAICKKTNKIAGDGTTTAIVLGESIYLATIAFLEANPDLNPQLVKESLEAASEEVIEMLKTEAKDVGSDENQIEQVATLSANGDSLVGKVIREAFAAVSSDGVITVDEAMGHQTTVEIIEGFQFKRGAESLDRFFNMMIKNRFEAENPLVLMYDGSLMDHNDLFKALIQIGSEYEKFRLPLPPIVIIANEFSSDVIRVLLMQKLEMQHTICAVRSPHTTNIRTAMLDDMAVYLGGTRLGNGNRNFTAFQFKIEMDETGGVSCSGDAGFAKKVIIDRSTTTFYGGSGVTEEDGKAVIDRIEVLKNLRQSAPSPYDASIISDRIAALSQGIAKIGVGGFTELEIKERYHRIEDAINAARAAVEGGVIRGGGAALYGISDKLGSIPTPTPGQQILSKALRAPIYQVILNVGINPKELALQTIVDNPSQTFDARNFKFVDAFEAGIIDPFKVTKTALENATSIASLLSTCGGAIVYPRDSE